MSKCREMVICLRNFKKFCKTQLLHSFGQVVGCKPAEKGHGGHDMLCKIDRYFILKMMKRQ